MKWNSVNKSGKKYLGSFWKKIKREKNFYLLFLPIFIYYVVFCYAPLGGMLLAFKEYSPRLGIIGSRWVGFDNFNMFFSSYNFWQIIRNTLRISAATLVFSFPAPIILAILINEIRSVKFKRTVQTITYLPHFVSLVVVVGLVVNFTDTNGLINDLIVGLGGKRTAFMIKENWFTPIYIISGIWQEIGWGSIIYLATIAGINQDLYEAADIDGAGRFGKIFHVTVPCLMPTITVLFIMQVGKIMSVGYEKIILMSNELTQAKAEVVSSYVYKLGFGMYPDYGYSTAVNVFNTVINVIILIVANKISNKLSETSLW